VTPATAPATRPRLIAAALGLSLCLLGLYILTSPGRIDMIDGQIRYEVARNWLDHGRPVVLDAALFPIALTVKTPHGVYGVYNASASLTAMPLMLLSRALPGHQVERERFVFAMVGPVFGAALGGLLVVAYSMLGLTLPRAVTWALVCTTATLWWPASTTIFDQNQHAVWLLLALLLAWQSGRRASLGLAMLAGVCGAVLVTYQENYALLLPLVGMVVAAKPSEGSGGAQASLRRPIDRATITRYVAFGATSGVGLFSLLMFNYARFGTLFYASRFTDPLLFGGGNDPLAASLGLLVSPGKGMFLFSPPLVLALLGGRRLFARAPALASAILAVSVMHLLVIMQLVFFGGDWCWGPRYLVILIPLWALAMPSAAGRVPRVVVLALVSLGVLVQGLGISLDHHRFFFERNLPPHFWKDQWFYMRDSQLFARPGELVATWHMGVPANPVAFSPTPRSEITYSPFGPRPPAANAAWGRQFTVFYLPRPWPLWIYSLDPARRPVEPWPWLALSGASMAVGAWLTWRTLHLVRIGATGETPHLTPDRDAGRG
jgi:hypothetical protein